MFKYALWCYIVSVCVCVEGKCRPSQILSESIEFFVYAIQCFTQLTRLPSHALPPNAMAVAYRTRCTETQMIVHVVFVYMETFLSPRAQCHYGCYTWEDCSEHHF